MQFQYSETTVKTRSQEWHKSEQPAFDLARTEGVCSVHKHKRLHIQTYMDGIWRPTMSAHQHMTQVSQLVGWCFTALSAQIGYTMPQK